MHQRPADQLAYVNPQATALRMEGDFRSGGDRPVEIFQPFVGGGQETRSGHRFPLCIGWAERIVMIGSAEIIVAAGQEISFHLAFVFTP